ncbi:hypothetical protein SDRG_12411 [Saprolegnia diclina VS20]|uniref:FYVE-type domain-containing protein n=1 Tax=Saprolegnia diclina (strain VS20) TaxID=1156394 RepID=T0Q5J2_SAPDV|nr:hypothetical protein SDRG_12411 [Saprolegnia diclina VS20]EQC29866.1 hypothetical protein SDRG_12411 [Saprolegnia diclina VS20]|eukprot:XP_008616705.1 hypothetical protein SDRG_12411 [Saprolegnia diclina VS20]
MVLPLPPDFFECPPLAPHETSALLALAQTICQETVQNALVLDAQPIWATIANPTTRRRARLRRGHDSVDAARDAMSCYTQVRATLEDVANVFHCRSTLELRTFGRVLGKSILDKVNLYTLVDRPVARGKVPHPLHYVGVEWAAIDAPLGFATRDLCYLEAHDEFEFVDTRNRKRRGWVRAIHSIENDACPSLHKAHGLVRASIYRSGHVFIESESNPEMLDYYNVIVADPRGQFVPRSVTQRCMKAHVSQALNLEEHLFILRLHAESQTTNTSMSWNTAVTSSIKSTAFCACCDAKFGLFLGRRTCDQCNRMVCKACSGRWTKATGAKPVTVCICKLCSKRLGDPEPVPLGNVTQALPAATQYNLRSTRVPAPRRPPVARKPVPAPSDDGGNDSDVIMLWDDGQASKRDGTFTFLSSSTSLHHTLRSNASGYQSTFCSYQYSDDGAPRVVKTVVAPQSTVDVDATLPLVSPAHSDYSEVFDAVLEFVTAHELEQARTRSVP